MPVAGTLPGHYGLKGERGAKISGDEAGGAGGAAEATGGKKAGLRKNRPRARVGVPAKCDGRDMGSSGCRWPGYRVQGVVPPLVLLPLELSPGQWEPLIPALAAHWTTITLGGAHLGSVASLEERGRSGYIDVVRGLLDQLAIRSGEQVAEVGCGSGVIMRELARRRPAPTF